MIRASGGDGIPVELFQILKDDAVKVLQSICQQIWKTQAVATGLEEVSFSFQSQRKAMPTNTQNNRTIALISHASKVILKILQARLQQYMNMNFQMFKLVLEKAEEPEIKLPTSDGSSKKQRVSEKHLFLLY